MTNIIFTQDYLQSIFDYKEGFLYYKRIRPKIKIGDKAGSLKKYKSGDRYVIRIDKKLYLTARIIFLYHKGYLPVFVDHEDRNSLNDKIENLRPATRNQNNSNVTSHVNSTSKYLGVCFHKRDQRWTAQLKTNGKQIYLGSFKIESDAALCYNKAAVKYHGEFANLNIIEK